MEFRRLSSDEYPEWNALVEESPTGTIFHSADWLTTLDAPFRIFGGLQNGNLVGGITLFEHTVLGQRMARGAALTPYNGLVTPVEVGKPVNVASNRTIFIRESGRFLRERYAAGSLHLSPVQDDVQHLLWQGFTADVRYTFVLDTSDPDRCWSNLDSSRRSGIRKAEREGFTARREDDPTDLIELVRKSYARQDEEASFADDLSRLIRGYPHRERLGVVVARDSEDAPVAATLVVCDDTRGYYLAGGYDHERDINNGLELALWTGIRWTAEGRGLREFDFEGSSVRSIARFFRKFGGELVPRFDVTWARPLLRVPMALRSAARRWKRRSD